MLSGAYPCPFWVIFVGKVFDEMASSAAYCDILWFFFAYCLLVLVVYVQVFFAAAERAFTAVMREEFLSFDLPGF